MNVITGTPRSGSTLLCNVLNQDPSVHASSTSPLAGLIGSTVLGVSTSDEVRSELIVDRDVTEARVRRMLSGLVHGWYDGEERTVFDKGRGWASNALTFFDLFPEGKMIAVIRDPRAILQSVEKQHARTPFFDSSMTPLGRTLFDRADKSFAPDGVIGQSMTAVEDLIRRDLPSLVFVKYEDLARDPELIVSRIRSAAGLEPFTHDFENVTNTADDVDGLYWGKFPHEGDGKVMPDDEAWRKTIAPDLSEVIVARYPLYCKTFGYA